MRIILSGGGTLGSVTPLIAIKQGIEKYSEEKPEFLWVGSRKGVEKEFIKKYNIPYVSISSGKLRRYFSFKNFLDPFKMIVGFFQSVYIILKNKPDIVLTSGSFISVPLAYASFILRVPIYVHHQDLEAGLANKAVSRIASLINVAFPENLKDFPKGKTVCLGNPIRDELYIEKSKKAYQIINLDENVPTLLIIGGGTGAEYINNLIDKNYKKLTEFCQIIHITGFSKGNLKPGIYQQEGRHKYLVKEFIAEELKYALAAADVVLTRAGMGSLTELLVLQKPMVIIPIKDNQQIKNAKYAEGRGAALVLLEGQISDADFIQYIKNIMLNKIKQKELAANAGKLVPKDSQKKIAQNILQIIKKKSHL